MLARIALHQTRLEAPGLALDAKGVALGAHGLVLVPTIDRLVAFLAIYTETRSLVDLLPGLEIAFVRTALGTREITVRFAAESSDRMDRVAEVARLVGGYTFTGAGRHFVQYRDAAGPFGYDATELLPTDAPLALYHDRFSQAYEGATPVDLRGLLGRLMLRPDPRAASEPGARYLVAEEGLGPALVHYLVRSQVDAEVTIAEWPGADPSDPTQSPVRRYVARVPALPLRMLPLFRTTPGLTTFVPAGPGVAVEVGYRHPVQLRACPVFDEGGLVLLRGRGEEAWSLPVLPVMGDVRALARVTLRGDDAGEPAVAIAAREASEPRALRVPLCLVPTSAPWHRVTASRVDASELPLLRRLAYSLPAAALRTTRIALTDRGAFLVSPAGIDAVPLGTFFTEILDGLYIPAGLEVVPRVAPEVIHRALGSQDGMVTFLGADGRAVAVRRGDFAPLDAALLEARGWDAATAESVAAALEEVPIDLALTPVGLFPLAGTSDAGTAGRVTGVK